MIISGGVAELGGAFLSLVAPNHYREGRTGGRGLFGYTDALQSRQGGTSVHALFGSLAMALAVFAAWLLQAKLFQALVSLAVVAGILALYFTTDCAGRPSSA